MRMHQVLTVDLLQLYVASIFDTCSIDLAMEEVREDHTREYISTTARRS